jgi:hypothetical protein
MACVGSGLFSLTCAIIPLRNGDSASRESVSVRARPSRIYDLAVRRFDEGLLTALMD